MRFKEPPRNKLILINLEIALFTTGVYNVQGSLLYLPVVTEVTNDDFEI